MRNPKGSNLGRPTFPKMAFIVFALCAVTPIASPAQNFNTLASFDLTNGQKPEASLIQATDGNFYGTTDAGGIQSCLTNGCGTVFKITPGSGETLTTLYSFCAQANCTDGENPMAGLAQATDGNLYGTTTAGGTSNSCTNGCGTVFKITLGGTLTTLYSFCAQANCTDGAAPKAGLIQATDGNLYGTTSAGGADGCPGFTENGCGTVFKITPTGTLTTLYSFCIQGYPTCADGYGPSGPLVQGTDGNLYGTAGGGGSNEGGTLFKITPAGTLTTLYTFCAVGSCADGSVPEGGLIQATDGNFYGTTSLGGNVSRAGTVFKITPAGRLTTLYSFCAQTNCTDGASPAARLVQATDGNLYGATPDGGVGIGGNKGCGPGCGTVFKITFGGTLTTLYRFCVQGFPCSDGWEPSAGLVQGTDGNFYGTTLLGGANNAGTIFSLSAICNVATLSVNAALYPAPVPLKVKFFVSLTNGPQPTGVCGGGPNNGMMCYESYTGGNTPTRGVQCGALYTCNPANGPSIVVEGMTNNLDNGVFQISRFVNAGQIKAHAPGGGATLNGQTGTATFSTTCP
jgi:uncharacterized repeat protein (TIGR03803 family)